MAAFVRDFNFAVLCKLNEEFVPKSTKFVAMGAIISFLPFSIYNPNK